jgi:hypothetical protein
MTRQGLHNVTIGLTVMRIESVQDVAGIATAMGVFFAAFQPWQTRARAITTFEDSLAGAYRQIIGRLPTEALLGEILRPEARRAQLHEFYRHFDLTNNQTFLRQIGRISKKTWSFWAEGIATNLARPAFLESWAEISKRAGSDFAELRRLIAEGFGSDPRRW